MDPKSNVIDSNVFVNPNLFAGCERAYVNDDEVVHSQRFSWTSSNKTCSFFFFLVSKRSEDLSYAAVAPKCIVTEDPHAAVKCFYKNFTDKVQDVSGILSMVLIAMDNSVAQMCIAGKGVSGGFVPMVILLHDDFSGAVKIHFDTEWTVAESVYPFQNYIGAFVSTDSVYATDGFISEDNVNLVQCVIINTIHAERDLGNSLIVKIEENLSNPLPKAACFVPFEASLVHASLLRKAHRRKNLEHLAIRSNFVKPYEAGPSAPNSQDTNGVFPLIFPSGSQFFDRFKRTNSNGGSFSAKVKEGAKVFFRRDQSAVEAPTPTATPLVRKPTFDELLSDAGMKKLVTLIRKIVAVSKTQGGLFRESGSRSNLNDLYNWFCVGQLEAFDQELDGRVCCDFFGMFRGEMLLTLLDNQNIWTPYEEGLYESTLQNLSNQPLPIGIAGDDAKKLKDQMTVQAVAQIADAKMKLLISDVEASSLGLKSDKHRFFALTVLYILAELFDSGLEAEKEGRLNTYTLKVLPTCAVSIVFGNVENLLQVVPRQNALACMITWAVASKDNLQALKTFLLKRGLQLE